MICQEMIILKAGKQTPLFILKFQFAMYIYFIFDCHNQCFAFNDFKIKNICNVKIMKVNMTVTENLLSIIILDRI